MEHWVFVCDLAPNLREVDLRKVFCFYGDVISLEHIDEASGGSALIAYSTKEAAQEATDIVHLASIRGKTCRCLLWNTVEAIWKTMDLGHRLKLEGLDYKITSQAVEDMFSLFGPVLDCKVQMDEGEQSRGYGFVHFAEKEHATKAMQLLNGMQIGSSCIQVRLARPEDLEVFTGCIYSLQTAVSAVCPSTGEWMGGMDHYASSGGWEDFDGLAAWETHEPHG